MDMTASFTAMPYGATSMPTQPAPVEIEWHMTALNTAVAALNSMDCAS
jgi:hypothetical protein